MIPVLIMFCLFALGMYCVKLYIGRSFTWPELGAACGIVLVVMTIGYATSMFANMSDTQILSGKVTGKNSEHVSCRHSYECNCHEECETEGEGSDEHESCTTECETCFEHDYDVDWNVHTTLGDITIDTIDRQGLKEPPRWSTVKTGDAVSLQSTYDNYIKAVPGTLYHRDANPLFTPPTYPSTIFDYYKINRTIDAGMGIDPNTLQAMNQAISDGLRDLAHAKQVNLVIVLTNNPNDMYFQYLKDAWMGGRKNDLVLVISSADHGKTIAWDNVFSWSSKDIVNVSIRNSVRDLNVVDSHVVDAALTGIQQYWSRKPMSDYAYLKHEIHPSTKAYAIIFFLGMLAAIIAVFAIESINQQDSSLTARWRRD